MEEKLVLPNQGYPGSELTLEPFRWDQKIIHCSLSFVLLSSFFGSRFIGVFSNPPFSIPPTSVMSEVTGGLLFSLLQPKTTSHLIESISVRLRDPGFIVVNIERKNFPIEKSKTMYFIPPSSSNPSFSFSDSFSDSNTPLLVTWPIPENYLPEIHLSSLPVRSSHPTLYFIFDPVQSGEEWVVKGWPFDKYEIEGGAGFLDDLDSKPPSSNSGVWQVYVVGSSGGSSVGKPFGYVKISRTSKKCYLIVLPYNYTKIMMLLNELMSKYQFSVTRNWKMEFENYLSEIPSYYIPVLRNALKRWFSFHNIQPINLIPEIPGNKNNEILAPDLMKGESKSSSSSSGGLGGLSYNVVNYLKKCRLQSIERNKQKSIERQHFNHTYYQHHHNTNPFKSSSSNNNSFSYNNKKNIEHQSLWDVQKCDLEEWIKIHNPNQEKTKQNSANYQNQGNHFVPIAQMGNFSDFHKQKNSSSQVVNEGIRVEREGDVDSIDEVVSTRTTGTGGTISEGEKDLREFEMVLDTDDPGTKNSKKQNVHFFGNPYLRQTSKKGGGRVVEDIRSIEEKIPKDRERGERGEGGRGFKSSGGGNKVKVIKTGKRSEKNEKNEKMEQVKREAEKKEKERVEKLEKMEEDSEVNVKQVQVTKEEKSINRKREDWEKWSKKRKQDKEEVKREMRRALSERHYERFVELVQRKKRREEEELDDGVGADLEERRQYWNWFVKELGMEAKLKWGDVKFAECLSERFPVVKETFS